MESHRKPIQAVQIQEYVGKSPIILEIGSHDGTDTVKFLQAMPQATIFCFEPEQRATAKFKRLLSGDARVTLCERAVADLDGSRQFWASTGKAGHREDWDLSGSLCKPTGHYTRSPEIKFKEPIPVACIRLDTWFANQHAVATIDFCWADVQGSQRLLLAGGQLTLRTTRYLYIESHNPVAYAGEPTQAELTCELAELRFEPIAIYAKENILFRNTLYA